MDWRCTSQTLTRGAWLECSLLIGYANDSDLSVHLPGRSNRRLAGHALHGGCCLSLLSSNKRNAPQPSHGCHARQAGPAQSLRKRLSSRQTGVSRRDAGGGYCLIVGQVFVLRRDPVSAAHGKAPPTVALAHLLHAPGATVRETRFPIPAPDHVQNQLRSRPCMPPW